MIEQKLHNYEHSKARIIHAGIKATQQRIVVYDALLNVENHPTVEQLFEMVKPGNPSISLGTVYKTLDKLIEVGLVEKVMSREGHMRYDANLANHNHIYCTNTGEIIDYYDEALNDLVKSFFSEKRLKNVRIQDIRLQINAEKVNPDEDVSIS